MRLNNIRQSPNTKMFLHLKFSRINSKFGELPSEFEKEFILRLRSRRKYFDGVIQISSINTLLNWVCCQSVGPLRGSDWLVLSVPWSSLVVAQRGVLASSCSPVSLSVEWELPQTQVSRDGWPGPASASQAVPAPDPPADQAGQAAQVLQEEEETCQEETSASPIPPATAYHQPPVGLGVSRRLREEWLRQVGGGWVRGEGVEEAVRQDPAEPGGGPAGEQQEGRACLSHLS